jgi:hypothetical protein
MIPLLNPKAIERVKSRRAVSSVTLESIIHLALLKHPQLPTVPMIQSLDDFERLPEYMMFLALFDQVFRSKATV